MPTETLTTTNTSEPVRYTRHNCHWIQPGRMAGTVGLLLCLALTGCGIPNLQFPGVYKVPIQQGNLITQEMVDQLRPGMTPRQVIFVMGTPLVRDPFHQERWDYVYNYEPGGGVRGQERITVFFENDLLSHITGDFRPSSASTVTAPESASVTADSAADS